MWGWIDSDREDEDTDVDHYESDERDESFRDEYAIVGTTDGCIFIRVTNPLSPEVLGKLPTAPQAEYLFLIYISVISIIKHIHLNLLFMHVSKSSMLYIM